ncbi:cysteine-rich protein 2-binding protein [Scaptodrosophila lebanonensis]|uniref:Cysteine-rich protein 2-binding protein n=1 Tax=Drosophila lebanonensis TaxID=7225 RepID=A0A6J2U6D8_DROLE|nr:cysteine-rich protein 2-binding protein [Scaptodrosophila lebanonensis]
MSLPKAPEQKLINCSYCEARIDDDNYLECQECNQCVQIKCLQRSSTPGDLLGDVFFDFTCIKCVRAAVEKTGTTSTAASQPQSEILLRQRMPWLLVLSLSLYNLSIKSKGLSHHGYFHWRTHIISFVDKNWNYLFGPRVRRRKQWAGSVSGTLSHNSPEYFQSGVDVFQEHGWWKLAKDQTPRKVQEQYEQKQQLRQQQRLERRLQPADEQSCDSDVSVTDNLNDVKPLNVVIAPEEALQTALPGESCARAIPYMGRPPKMVPQPEKEAVKLLKPEPPPDQEPQQQQLNPVQASLLDFLTENLGGDDLTMFNSLPGIMPEPLIGAGKSDFFMTEALLEAPAPSMGLFEMETNFNLPPTVANSATDRGTYYAAQQSEPPISDNACSSMELSTAAIYEEDDMMKSSAQSDHTDTEQETEDGAYQQPRIVQITNYQAKTTNPEELERKQQLLEVDHIKEEAIEETPEDAEEEETLTTKSTVLEPCKPSGFIRQPRRNWPWLAESSNTDDTNETSAENLTLMSVYEEQELHLQLQKFFTLEQEGLPIDIPAYVRRLYRKLCVRKWKREHNRPIFNLDEYIDPTIRARRQFEQRQEQILDRYQLITHSYQNANTSFYARITGSIQYEFFESPYSKRVLHPFIFRSKEIGPPWLRLMCELQHRVNGEHPTRSTIDFCYVRPQHIAAVNALLQSAFWPGIDVSDCLSYPDYSVVALYKKLVVGCGFLVPDVGYNEAYITFMAVRPHWQRSGIATYMLYHLIQTCQSKDITLHVSASNTAVLLYQKFGFKMEEIVLGFYDKYLPLDSKESRKAFFLRLSH